MAVTWQESFRELQRLQWQIAEDHGWHDRTDTTFGDRLCLIHSEVSEALEEYRNGYSPRRVRFEGATSKPEGVPIELADVIIRVLDLAEIYCIDLTDAIETKMRYNSSRPYRHGNKVL